jgi:hypothetical protein
MKLNQGIKRSIQLITFLFVSIIAYAQQKDKDDYSDFRTGKFTYSKSYEFNGKTYHYSSNINLDTVRVIRTKDRQTELYPEDGKKSVYAIRWVSKFSYEMTLLESTKGLFAKGDKIVVDILSRTDSSYTYISKSKLGSIKATLIKYKPL